MSMVKLVQDVASNEEVLPLSARERFFRNFSQHKLAVAAAVYLCLLVVLALFGESLVRHDPVSIQLDRVLEGPSADYWLGTDHLGRSTLSRVIVASGVALKAAAIGVGIAVVVGAPLGLLSGYLGGLWDRVAMRIVEAVISLPNLLVAIAILAILGPRLTNAMIALGFAMSTAFFRLMRGAALEVREALYVDAAQVVGASTARILRHVLPNVTGPLTVQTTLAFSFVLLAEAGLSFIGLGVQPPEASWGVMLATSQNYIYQNPFMAVPPGLMIMFTVLAFNLLGDGLRDALAHVEPETAPPPRKSKPVSSTDDLVESALLSVKDLEVTFRLPTGLNASVVSGVSFELGRGQTVGLVGESGCGKSVTAMSILRLLPASGHMSGGQILLKGKDISLLPDHQLNQIRGSQISMIFQEPMSSLNPAFTVKDQIAESLKVHEGLTKKQAGNTVIELLERVGIPDPHLRADNYPHQFSGGMAQRVMIAMAISCKPDLLIADEPTTALDVTIQGQVLDLLSSLQAENNMSILLITHDLGVIADMCDQALVMYAGQVVERGTVQQLLKSPRHPYTAGLLASTPRFEKRTDSLRQIPGRVPPAWAWPEGCRFHPRCPHASNECKSEISLATVSESHESRCIRTNTLNWEHVW